MKILRRCLVTIKKKSKKFSLLLALVTLVATIVSFSISINFATRNVEANLRYRMPTIITIEYVPRDFRVVLEWDFDERNSFIQEVVHPLGELDYVNVYHFTSRNFVDSIYMRPYVSDEELEIMKNVGLIPNPPGEGWNNAGWQFTEGATSEDIIYIISGELEIVSGRTFNTDEIKKHANETSRESVAIISRRYANFNDVWVGDNIIFGHRATYPPELLGVNLYYAIEYNFEVVGIWDFVNQADFEDHSSRSEQDMMLNTIFIPNHMSDLMERDAINYHHCQHGSTNADCTWFFSGGNLARNILPYFVLSDALYIDNFSAVLIDLQEEGLAEGWEVVDHSNRFGAINHATDMLLEVTNMTMWVAVGIGVVLISLLILLFIQDRRHEVGIYLALGEKRAKILLQILIEIMVVSIVGITTALFIGNVVSGRLSEEMLRNELVSYNERDKEWWEDTPNRMEVMFGFPELTHDEMVEAFDTSLTFPMVALFYAAGLAVVAISTAVPIIYLVKLSPKKVLL